jgi:hypothetical protein
VLHVVALSVREIVEAHIAEPGEAHNDVIDLAVSRSSTCFPRSGLSDSTVAVNPRAFTIHLVAGRCHHPAAKSDAAFARQRSATSAC